MVAIGKRCKRATHFAIILGATGVSIGRVREVARVVVLIHFWGYALSALGGAKSRVRVSGR
jgi:hypothetical protein